LGAGSALDKLKMLFCGCSLPLNEGMGRYGRRKANGELKAEFKMIQGIPKPFEAVGMPKQHQARHID